MPRPDVSAERKAQILQAAQQVFARQSFHSVTMQTIAQAAGLSVGGVYWYFKSKDEIIAALLARNAEPILDRLRQLANDDAPTATRLETFFREIVAAGDEIAALYSTGIKLYAMTDANPQLRNSVSAIGAAYRDGLATLIRQGVERGEFQAVDAADAATALLGLYEGMMLLKLTDSQSFQVERVLQTGAMLILRGLQAHHP